LNRFVLNYFGRFCNLTIEMSVCFSHNASVWFQKITVQVVLIFCSPQSGHGVYTTPIDFYLTKKGFPSSQWNKIL